MDLFGTDSRLTHFCGGTRKMLTGVHPFDIQGRAADEDIEREVNLSVVPCRVGVRTISLARRYETSTFRCHWGPSTRSRGTFRLPREI